MNKHMIGLTIGGMTVGILLTLVFTLFALQYSNQATGSPASLTGTTTARPPVPTSAVQPVQPAGSAASSPPAPPSLVQSAQRDGTGAAAPEVPATAVPEVPTATSPAAPTATGTDTEETYLMLEYAEYMRQPLVVLNDTVMLMGVVITSVEAGALDEWQQDGTYVVQQMDSLAATLPQSIPAVAESTHAAFVDAMLACQFAAEGFRLSLQQANPALLSDPQMRVYLTQCRTSLDTYNAQMQPYLFHE